MALHDEVLRDIAAGRVPWRFRTRDLKKIPGNTAGRYMVGNGDYSENAINAIPRNHSIRPDGTDPGDYVRKGRKPAFFWFGKGEYELILDHEHYLDDIGSEDDQFEMAEGDEETLIRGNPHGVAIALPIKVNGPIVLRIAAQVRDGSRTCIWEQFRGGAARVHASCHESGQSAMALGRASWQ